MWDYWTDKGPLAKIVNHSRTSGKILVEEFFRGESWDFNKLERVIPIEIAQHISGIPRGRWDQKDYTWRLTDDGHYSNTTARHMVRTTKQRNPFLGKFGTTVSPSKCPFSFGE